MELLPELHEIKERMLSQDNRCTAHPMYLVQEFGSGTKFGTWLFVDVFFTNEAAKQFIADNFYNYGTLRIYIESGYRNKEWQAVRKFLRGDDSDT